MDLNWCEIDTGALRHNARALKNLLLPDVLLGVVVKSNAYGHGLELAAQSFLAGGADWLCVNSLQELVALRAADIQAPIYVLGYVALSDLQTVVELNGRLVVYNAQTIEQLGRIARAKHCTPIVHVKLETGNNRQGVLLDEAIRLADKCRDEGLLLEGISSHFANIEDTTDHTFAFLQLEKFHAGIRAVRARGHKVPLNHIANSAATLLWDQTQFGLARVGIASYGLWPSRETYISAYRDQRERIALRPALAWKTRIAQLKWLEAGDFIGYGCTFRTTRKTRLAILPVGYYDGYCRSLSNLAYVLVGGQRAPVRGRVCMNVIMVDVTDIGDALLEHEVVLLGSQGEERISAEQLADWAGTINYEIVTTIGSHIPRVALLLAEQV